MTFPHRRRLLMGCSLPHAILLTAMMMWMASSGGGVLANAAEGTPVTVPLCLGFNIYEEVPPEQGGKSVLDIGYLRNAAAAAMAVRDVNALDCTIYGSDDCADIVSWEGGRIILNATLFDTQTFAPTVGPVVVSMCNSIDGQAIVTGMTSSQTESAALMGGHFGLPQLSGVASTPELSNTDFYSLFGRLVLSSAQMARAIAAFISSMEWQQVALLHISNSFGQSYAEVFFPEATRQGFKATSFAIGASTNLTAETIQPVMQRLQESGIKVIHLALPVKQTAQFLLAAHDLGFPVKEYVWLNQITLLAVQGMLFNVPDDRKALLRELMEGFVSLSVRYPFDGATGQERKQQWLDSLATLDLGEMSSILRNADGEKDPRLAPSTSAMLASEDAFWEPEVNTYDAVWAIAAGFAAAHRDGSAQKGDVRPGVAAFRQLTATAGAVSFEGISGRVSFDEGGERHLSDVTLNILNLVTLPDGVTYPPVVVGHISFDGNTSEVVIDDGYPPIRWPDGSVYPTIPWDGLSTASFDITPIIAPTGVALGLLLVLTAWLVYRNKHLQNRVYSLTRMEEIDIESPLAKILDFLKRYKDSSLLRGPGRLEAAMLHDLICHHNGSLASPDLMQQLKDSPHLGNHFMKHLIQTTARNELGYGEITPSTSFDSSFTPSVKQMHWLDNNGDEVDDVVEELAAGEDESQHRSIASVEHGILAAYSAEDALIGGVSVPLIDCITLRASQVEVPARLIGVVGRDYFMDFITAKSAVQDCPSPLALVAKSSIDCLGVQHVLGPDGERKLTSYATQIESGYPITGYHCQRHAADVTNRVVALLVRTGIAQGGDEGDATWMLATLTAAMMHDYDHPHLNNQYLVALGFDIAKNFNDQAVAENHSLRHGLAIMEHEQLDFISDWNRKTRQQLRSIVIQAVLSTDMSRHFELLTQFQAKVVDAAELGGLTSRQKWEAMDHAQKILTIQIAMKVSDIGACALPIEQHIEWNSRLQEEFFRQGDREKGHGLPPSFLMDRKKPGVQDGKNQAGFFKFIVLPLMSAWVKVFPECQSLLNQAQANHKHWETLGSEDANIAGEQGQKPLKAKGSTAPVACSTQSRGVLHKTASHTMRASVD